MTQIILNVSLHDKSLKLIQLTERKNKQQYRAFIFLRFFLVEQYVKALTWRSGPDIYYLCNSLKFQITGSFVTNNFYKQNQAEI